MPRCSASCLPLFHTVTVSSVLSRVMFSCCTVWLRGLSWVLNVLYVGGKVKQRAVTVEYSQHLILINIIAITAVFFISPDGDLKRATVSWYIFFFDFL